MLFRCIKGIKDRDAVNDILLIFMVTFSNLLYDKVIRSVKWTKWTNDVKWQIEITVMMTNWYMDWLKSCYIQTIVISKVSWTWLLINDSLSFGFTLYYIFFNNSPSVENGPERGSIGTKQCALKFYYRLLSSLGFQW